ncbi:Yip1 family protein [Bermanella sp. R86510]|uniref:Yip1 family protein n=1 Tax=unclassified Bermanella TaxID=2627862 RepID=UPI0037C68252
MYFQHMFGLLYHPKAEWDSIKKENHSLGHIYLTHLAIMALIPPFALLVGTTQFGWSFVGKEFYYLTFESALPLAVGFYFALLIGMFLMAYCTYWMEKTFGAEASLERCLLFTTYTSTPMFLSGFAGLLPILWLDVFIVMAAVSYTVYLLYAGVPVFMNIPEERGFIFASSILTVGLCALVGLMAFTIIIWEMGFMPQIIGG